MSGILGNSKYSLGVPKVVIPNNDPAIYDSLYGYAPPTVEMPRVNGFEYDSGINSKVFKTGYNPNTAPTTVPAPINNDSSSWTNTLGDIFGKTDSETGKFNFGWGLPAINTLGNMYGLYEARKSRKLQEEAFNKNYALAMDQWNTQKAASQQSAEDMIRRRQAEGIYSVADADRARTKLGLSSTTQNA